MSTRQSRLTGDDRADGNEYIYSKQLCIAFRHRSVVLPYAEVSLGGQSISPSTDRVI